MSTALAQTPYQKETMTVGLLDEQEVTAVRMPRARFTTIFERTLEDRFDYDPEIVVALRKELLPVVETMPRFPLGSWVDTERGCGCVVGEYLIASGEQSRKQFVEMAGELGLILTVDARLSKHPYGTELRAIGLAIDDAISEELDAAGILDRHGDLIKDRAHNAVESVEIEDVAA